MEEALQQRRGCLPGGCLRASTELPACATPALASFLRQTQMKADSPARAVKIKPREPGAAVSAGWVLGAIPGAAASVLVLSGDAPAKVLCPRMAAARGCWQGAAHATVTIAVAGMATGRESGALPALAFQSGRCTRNCQHAGITGSARLAGLCQQGCSCAQHLPRDCTPASPWAQGAEEKVALEHGTAGNCCGKAPPAPQPSSAGGNLNLLLLAPAPGSG